MKLQKILSNFQKLHPKEIDLSLDRIKKLCEKLGNPQNDIKCIQVCGTNGKGSTISFLHSILKEAKKAAVRASKYVRGWPSFISSTSFNNSVSSSSLIISSL